MAHGNIGLSLLGPGRPGTLAAIINILIQGGDLRFQLRDTLVDGLDEFRATCGAQGRVGPHPGQFLLGQVQIRRGRIPLNDGDVALQVRFGNRGSGPARFHLGVFHLLISRAQGIFLFQQGLQSAVVSLLLHLFVGS